MRARGLRDAAIVRVHGAGRFGHEHLYQDESRQPVRPLVVAHEGEKGGRGRGFTDVVGAHTEDNIGGDVGGDLLERSLVAHEERACDERRIEAEEDVAREAFLVKRVAELRRFAQHAPSSISLSTTRDGCVPLPQYAFRLCISSPSLPLAPPPPRSPMSISAS